MKACRTFSPLLHSVPSRASCSSIRAQSRSISSTDARAFLSNPFKTELQTLTATRTVPYPSSVIYSVVSDVSSYSAFLPFCRSSTVTKTSSPDADGNTWPEEAKLLIGWNDDISEEFCSRVYCKPGLVVEAVSGATNTSLAPHEIEHHSQRAPPDRDPARKATVLTQLSTRWTLRPFPVKPDGPQPAIEKTEVSLAIDYQFANPVYAAMSAATAPKVAGYMMEAFEKRVRNLVDAPPGGGGAEKVGALEGVLRPRGESP